MCSGNFTWPFFFPWKTPSTAVKNPKSKPWLFFPTLVKKYRNLHFCRMKGLRLEENSLIHKIRITLSHQLLDTEYSLFSAKDLQWGVWKCHTVEMIALNINRMVLLKQNARRMLGFVLKLRYFLLLAKKWSSTLVANNVEDHDFDAFGLWFPLRRGILWLFFSSGLTVYHHRIGIQEMSWYF